MQRDFAWSRDFDRTFERFELLATLRHAQDKAPKAWLEQSANASQGYFPSPIGRMETGFMSLPPLVQELKRPTELAALGLAGFMGGDSQWLDMTLDALGRSMMGMRYHR